MSKVHLGDVAVEARETIKDPSGLPVVGLEHLIPGEIELTQWAEGNENTFTKSFHKGQILFGRRRAYQKKASVATIDGVCSGDITVIAAKEDRILPELLPFVVNDDRFFDYAMEKSAGSLSPRVKWVQLAEYEFVLPDDFDKQKELANLLWAMERTRKAYKELLLQVDELVKSQFVEMFGDPKQNTKGWPLLRLQECLYGIDSGKSLTCEGHPRSGDFPAILKLSAVTYGEYDPYENKQLPSADMFVPALEVHDGDLLFSRKNTREYVGMTALVKQTPINLMLPDLIFRLLPNEKVRSEYLHQLINHTQYRSVISGLASGTAGSMPNISKQKLFALEIPLPPVEQQMEFESFIEQTDKSKLAIKDSLDSLEKSRSAIMKQLFG